MITDDDDEPTDTFVSSFEIGVVVVDVDSIDDEDIDDEDIDDDDIDENEMDEDEMDEDDVEIFCLFDGGPLSSVRNSSTKSPTTFFKILFLSKLIFIINSHSFIPILLLLGIFTFLGKSFIFCQ